MSIILRSTLIVSGIVNMHLYPRSRAMKASAMPVLPLVGSTSIDSPGVIRPFSSASSIKLLPNRSLTEEHGPNDSSFPHSFTPLLTRYQYSGS